MSKIFNINEKTQEKLVNKGYADVIEMKKNSLDVVTVTKNGIIVSVKQTLVDKYGMQIYLNVKSTNGLKLTGDRFFNRNDIYVDYQDIYCNYGAGFLEKSIVYLITRGFMYYMLQVIRKQTL